MGSMPIYKIVFDGVDGGEDSLVLAGYGAYGAHAVFSHFANGSECRLRGGSERIAWVTMFSLEDDGWLLVNSQRARASGPAAAGHDWPLAQREHDAAAIRKGLGATPLEPADTACLECGFVLGCHDLTCSLWCSPLSVATLEPDTPLCACGARPAGTHSCDNYGAW